MTTINLTGVLQVDESPTAGAADVDVYVPTVSSYATWYEVARIEWESAASDVITCTGWVTTAISGITCSGTDWLAVKTRAVLRNVTTGSNEVWAGAHTQQIYSRIGTVEYGPLLDLTSFNMTFIASSPGLLIPGNVYRWHIEVMKEQVVNTPTLTLTVVDSSAFATSAIITA